MLDLIPIPQLEGEWAYSLLIVVTRSVSTLIGIQVGGKIAHHVKKDILAILMGMLFMTALLIGKAVSTIWMMFLITMLGSTSSNLVSIIVHSRLSVPTHLGDKFVATDRLIEHILKLPIRFFGILAFVTWGDAIWWGLAAYVALSTLITIAPLRQVLGKSTGGDDAS